MKAVCSRQERFLPSMMKTICPRKSKLHLMPAKKGKRRLARNDSRIRQFCCNARVLPGVAPGGNSDGGFIYEQYPVDVACAATQFGPVGVHGAELQLPGLCIFA